MAIVFSERKEDPRDLPVLEGLRGGKNVSQRRLAERLGMAPSQVNRCIGELLKAGLVQVVDATVRPFAYRLTPAGEEYRRSLIHRRFDAVVGSLQEMRSHIRQRLAEIADNSVCRLVLYGTGEVMEVALPLVESLELEVVGVVDDDPDKQGTQRGEHQVQPPQAIAALHPDAVLITTFRHARQIRNRMDDDLASSVAVLEL